MTRALRSPIKYPGGNHRLAPKLLPLLPPHSIYVEPFFGGGSMFFLKPPAKVEIINDINHRVVRLFRVLRVSSDEFIRQASLVPYSRAEFDDAFDHAVAEITSPAGEDRSCIEAAVDDFILWRQSHGGQGKHWSPSTTRSRGGRADVVNAWMNAIDMLPAVSQRLLNAQIEHLNALDILAKYDDSDAFFYCDPPWDTEEVSTPDLYEHPFTKEDHEKLAASLRAIEGKAMVLGYRSDLYDALYHDWRRHDVEVPLDQSGSANKPMRVVSAWMNYA